MKEEGEHLLSGMIISDTSLIMLSIKYPNPQVYSSCRNVPQHQFHLGVMTLQQVEGDLKFPEREQVYLTVENNCQPAITTMINKVSTFDLRARKMIAALQH